MQMTDEQARCLVCNRIFCCADCRVKHEICNHSIQITRRHSMPFIHLSASNIEAILDGRENPPPLIEPTPATMVNEGLFEEKLFMICPICKNKPLVLKAEMYEELLVHIEHQHLPLRCRKCKKFYTKLSDLKEFTKCLNNADECSVSQETSTHSDKTSDSDSSSKNTVKIPSTVAHSTMSTQTSPMPTSGQQDEADSLTPISIINMRWKAKSKLTNEEFISDSVSSIRNLSSISNSSLRRSIGQSVPLTKNTRGKPIRSTSTPLHFDMLIAKSKEPTFNASGGYMSSINHSGFECEQSLPPASVNNNGCTPAKRNDNNLQRYGRVGGGRSKITPITPLRQVMSKSIHRAFVEHGMPRNAFLQHRRNMYEPTEYNEPIEQNAHEPNINEPLVKKEELAPPKGVVATIADDDAKTSCAAPLDLRLSPALRRTQSEGDSYCLNRLRDIDSSVPSRIKRQRLLMLSSQRLTTTESIIITTHTQHVAGSITSASSTSVAAETARTSLENKMIKAYSIGNELSSHNEFDGASSSSASLGAASYKSCESVEIITASSTEPSKINVAITPITRIPGAVINKKIIKFETPIKEISMDELKNDDEKKKLPKTPDDDIFYTPKTASPKRKINNLTEFENSSSNEKEKRYVVRQLNRRFSPPKPRPPLRRNSNLKKSFSSVEDITNDLSDAENVSPNKQIPKQEQEQRQHKPSQSKQGAGRLWSLVSSVMWLPKRSSATDSGQSSKSNTENNSKSIIKRCASIAGSLVRPKPMFDGDDYDEQLQSLKRKRTYTMDDQISTSTAAANSREFKWANASSPPTKLSKCLKIQGRKPIERMRWNN